MNNTDVEMYKLLERHFGEEEAEKFVALLNEKKEQDKLDLKEVFLTKQDKTELIEKINDLQANLTIRMDNHFKWSTGVMIAAISLAVTFLKLTSS